MNTVKTNVTINDIQSDPATAPVSSRNTAVNTTSQFPALKKLEKVPDMFNNCKVKMPETFL